MFSCTLPHRREFQIGVKSGTVERVLLGNRPGHYPVKSKSTQWADSKQQECPEQGGGRHMCDGSTGHLHMGGTGEASVRNVEPVPALSPAALCNMPSVSIPFAISDIPHHPCLYTPLLTTSLMTTDPQNSEPALLSLITIPISLLSQKARNHTWFFLFSCPTFVLSNRVRPALTFKLTLISINITHIQNPVSFLMCILYYCLSELVSLLLLLLFCSQFSL